MHIDSSGTANCRVVIVGAGFGGIEVARELGAKAVPVTLIDRQNHHLFQPLLYQVATAALSPSDIAAPIRGILRDYPSVDVVLGEVCSIDMAAKFVRTADSRTYSFDHAVFATGAMASYFGHDDWSRFAPGLKCIEDARRIRSRLLFSFELAELATEEAEQRRLMTTVVVGAGPTGVELAGSIAELARYTLVRDFRRISPANARVILVEAGPTVLSAFSEQSSDYAEKTLTKLGVEVRLGSEVEAIGDKSILVNGEHIAAGLIIWAAGVKATPAASWLGATSDKAGRVLVNPDLSVPGADGIYLLGDAALCFDAEGKPLPGLAQVAKQQGRFLGKALASKILHGNSAGAFVFQNRGNVAIIGRHAAVFEIGPFKLMGRTAWLAWAIVHVYLLIGFQNRVLVSIQWFWRYLTYERGARLIADDPGTKADLS